MTIALGLLLLMVGAVYALGKGWLVWTVSRDPMRGAGVPLIDFVLLGPVPLAGGAHLLLSGLGRLPHPDFGIYLWIGLFALFAAVFALFHRLGEPHRTLLIPDSRREARPGGGSAPRESHKAKDLPR